MLVNYDCKTESYSIKEKLSNGQTLFMWFQNVSKTKTGVYYNVVLGVYSKRKHADMNEVNAKITGKNPMETIGKAIQAFKTLEEEVWKNESQNGRRMTIVVGWVDNRRRDAYNCILSKKGFFFTQYWGEKVLMKHYEPEDYAKIYLN